MLEIGDKAPHFESVDQDGNPVSLSDFLGKKVVLYFYPKDDTPGCTAEACDFRDHYSTLQSKGIEILGVSIDNQQSHKKFVDKFELPFMLVVDEDKKIVEQYGVWAEKNMYGRKYMGTVRKTFLIDEQGNIVHIVKKVKTKEATKQVLDFFQD